MKKSMVKLIIVNVQRTCQTSYGALSDCCTTHDVQSTLFVAVSSVWWLTVCGLQRGTHCYKNIVICSQLAIFPK